ncbi:MAG TPA: ribonuclease D [Fimbriiglobus sp.]|nr:ribonuclease D [Fimbriiglobus sp.]
MTRRPFQPPALPEHAIDRPDRLAACLDLLRAADHVGFDTEFVGEDSYRPDLCLVQVAIRDHLFLIDPLGCGPLDEFWDLLHDPNRVVVVHAGREEVRMCRFATGRPPTNVADVQVAAALVGMTFPIGYGGLVQEVLGARAHKGETLTDWRRRPLTPNQVRYAFDDVRYLLPLWGRLSDRLKTLKRGSWAVEEFKAFVTRATADDPAVEKWRRLKGLGGLGRRELAVAREVYVWREDFAARLNRPPRVLLRDDLIVEIARRATRHPDDVHSLRGVPRGETEAILSTVHRALALPQSECPAVAERENDPPHVATLAALLGVVLAELCGRLRLAPNLVATSADLKALVRARQPGGKSPADTQLAHGWRASAIRPHLEAVLDGAAVLRVTDPASPNPVTVQATTLTDTADNGEEVQSDDE